MRDGGSVRTKYYRRFQASALTDDHIITSIYLDLPRSTSIYLDLLLSTMDQMKDTQLPCSVATCRRWFKNQSGLTQHMRRIHQSYFAPSPLDELDESDEDVYDSDESEW